MHMTDGITLSVITPSFNHAQWIRETIESVLAQDFPNTEHIVIDGGSTDGTVGILREYGERFPERFRWVSEPDRGQSDAFNKGLAMARGEYVGWQNSDDYYLNNAFARLLSAFRHDPSLAVVYGDCVTVDGEGRRLGSLPVGPFDPVRLLYRNNIANQSALIRRDALHASGGIDTSLHYLMDWDLWLRLALKNQLKYVPGNLGALRILPTAKTHVGLLQSRLEAVRIVDQTLASTQVTGDAQVAGRSALERHLLDALVAALAFNELDCAHGLLSRALEDYSANLNWTYFCRRVLMRRVITEQWYGHLDSDSVSQVPKRAHRLLLEQGCARTPIVRQAAALSLLFSALNQKSHGRVKRTTRSVSYMLRAIQTDRSFLAYPESSIALLRLALGNGATDMLNPFFHKFRTLADSLYLLKGSKYLFRLGLPTKQE